MQELIIVFALVVQLPPETDEKVASYWFYQKHCLNDARLLTRREDNYHPIVAYCRPEWVDPSEQKVQGYDTENKVNK
tara:strand:+ start:824 stop:1054 length:231 start_codon:yes stop_codon:yes gene_type:complete